MKKLIILTMIILIGVFTSNTEAYNTDLKFICYSSIKKSIIQKTIEM